MDRVVAQLLAEIDGVQLTPGGGATYCRVYCRVVLCVLPFCVVCTAV